MIAGACDAAVFWILLAPGVGAALQHSREVFGRTYGTPTEPLLGEHSGILVVGLLVLGLGGWASLQWPGICSRGQSIGKRIAGIRIVTNSSAPGFVRGVVLRQVLPLVFPFVCCLWMPVANQLPGVLHQLVGLSLLAAGIGALPLDLLCSLGTQRRSLRDRLAGSRIIRC